MIDTETDISTAIKCKNGELVVYREQDVEPYLDANKREISGAPTWRPYAGRKLTCVADIPNIVVEQWMREGINVFHMHDPEVAKKVRAKLDSNEFAHLRTFPGKLGMRKQWV